MEVIARLEVSADSSSVTKRRCFFAVKPNSKKILDLMIAKDVTVSYVSDASGISRQSIYDILKGKHVKSQTLIKIAKALSVPVEDISCMKEDKP